MAETPTVVSTPVGDGQWGTVAIEIPDWFETARDKVNSLFEFLDLGLEFLNTLLEFAKTFLVAYLDPISALIQAIIAEIEALIKDFRQVGLYLTGDWALLDWPLDDLKGGYQAYERRMISRLSDRTDPTRPDVSSRTPVIGFFSYLSVDVSEYIRLYNFIKGMIKLFGISWSTPSPFPVPTIGDVMYGVKAISLTNPSSFKALGNFDSLPPDQARMTWTVQPAGMKHPLNPIPQTGPRGFIITVSTFENPISLYYNRAAKNPGKERKNGVEGESQQGREMGQVLDASGTPVALYGGADMVNMLGSPLQYNDSFDSDGLIRDQKGFVFGRVDPNSSEMIPLESLKDGDTYFFQRTYFVDSIQAWAQWAQSEYSITLDLADLPHRGKLTAQDDGTVEIEDLGVGGTYYVRVAACKAEVGTEAEDPKWVFNDDTATALVDLSPEPFRVAFESGLDSVGAFSRAKRLTFPNANTVAYLNAIESALVVLTLSRSDLPLLDTTSMSDEQKVAFAVGDTISHGVVAEYTGMEASKGLIGQMFPDISELTAMGGDPVQFRGLLRDRVKQLARDIYRKTGPLPDIERAVVEATPNLREGTWTKFLASVGGGQLPALVGPPEAGNDDPTLGGTTIMGALSDSDALGVSIDYGIAANLGSMGVEAQDEIFFSPVALQGRLPDFYEWTNGEAEEVVTSTATTEETNALLQGNNSFLAHQYEKHVQHDYTTGENVMVLPTRDKDLLTKLAGSLRTTGSYDEAPVFVYSPGEYLPEVDLEDRIVAVFLRHVFRMYEDGILYQEANTALQAAASALSRSPQDGEWIAIRLFDAFPAVDNFLESLQNWIKTLLSAIESIVDTILKYIEFLQAAISDLQSLLRRINSLILSLLSFAVVLPLFNGVMIKAMGTDNLLADFISAENKPSDGPEAYGAGIAVVAVSPIPMWVIDLFFLIQDNKSGGEGTPVDRPLPPIGIEDVSPVPEPEPEPDPL